MKNIYLVAGTALLSCLPFAAIAGSSTQATPQQIVQQNIEKHLAAERAKYNRMVGIAKNYNKQDELTTKNNEVISAYKKWHDLTSVVVASHHASSKDYEAIKIAAETYSDAFNAFINFQKGLLAQYSVPTEVEPEWVATNTLTNRIQIAGY
ncbi:MAG: hypothetical protein WBM09_12405 [Gallionella sp.]